MSNEFLEDLFGEQEGIVYSPVKDGSDTSVPFDKRKWIQHFFEWPKERDKLERHLNDFGERDVYLSPALFSEKRISPETFKGTNYLWTEFDGTIPNEFIEPSIRVSSSVEGHEHWYWRLNEFATDRTVVEDYTRRLTYHYHADVSGWPYSKVLRPPDTWNHKRNKPVVLLDKKDVTYNSDKFSHVPIAPSHSKLAINLTELPKKEIILAKYRWPEDTIDLLFKEEIATGSRSDAMMRLAHDCVDVGCSNEEIFVLLEDRDTIWGKYLHRSDRNKRLQDFISSARSRKSKEAGFQQDAPEVYRFLDFMNTNIKLEWVIEGLLPVAGSMVIFGRPGVGKSTFSLRMIEAIALGRKDFLGWTIKKRQRTLFVSLEMQDYEVKEFFKDMNISAEEAAELQEWFHIWPIGHAYPLDTPDQQIAFLKYIDLFKIETVVIDSHGLAMYGSVSKDDDVKRLNSFLNEDVRKARKCSYVFIHHPRKPGNGEINKEMSQDDSFGSQYIVANAQTVLILEQKANSAKLNIRFAKTRMAMKRKELDIERTPDRGFQLVGASLTQPATVTVVTSDSPENREETGDEERNALTLGQLFSL